MIRQILKLLKVVDVPPGKPSIVEADIYLRTGRDSDGPSNDGIRLIPFGLGVQVPKNTQASDCKGPGLAIQWVDVEELEGTLPGQRLLFDKFSPKVQEAMKRNVTLKTTKLLREELKDVMKESFERIGARLFRRDLTEIELSLIVNKYMDAVDSGDSLKTAFVNEVAVLMTVGPQASVSSG